MAVVHGSQSIAKIPLSLVKLHTQNCKNEKRFRKVGTKINENFSKTRLRRVRMSPNSAMKTQKLSGPL